MTKKTSQRLSRLKRDYPGIFEGMRFEMNRGALARRDFRSVGLDDLLVMRSFGIGRGVVTLVYHEVFGAKPGGSRYESKYRLHGVNYFLGESETF